MPAHRPVSALNPVRPRWIPHQGDGAFHACAPTQYLAIDRESCHVTHILTANHDRQAQVGSPSANASRRAPAATRAGLNPGQSPRLGRPSGNGPSRQPANPSLRHARRCYRMSAASRQPAGRSRLSARASRIASKWCASFGAMLPRPRFS